MEKGFTLIELLAVIVILAIIALIATPIILGIINDARQESNERSIELYANAIRNGIATHQLKTGNKVEAKTYKSEELTFVEYEGDVECDTIEYYTDGKVYVADCKVNGVEVDYTYGTKQVFKPQYYWFQRGVYGNIGDDLPSGSRTNVSEIDTEGRPYYIGLDVDSNNKVSAAYSCFIRNETEYCLKPSSDGSSYEINKAIIKDAFSDVVDTDFCRFDVEFMGIVYSECWEQGLEVYAQATGRAFVTDGLLDSVVYENDRFGCHEN